MDQGLELAKPFIQRLGWIRNDLFDDLGGMFHKKGFLTFDADVRETGLPQFCNQPIPVDVAGKILLARFLLANLRTEPASLCRSRWRPVLLASLDRRFDPSVRGRRLADRSYIRPAPGPADYCGFHRTGGKKWPRPVHNGSGPSRVTPSSTH
jgi:hypothetical protein